MLRNNSGWRRWTWTLKCHTHHTLLICFQIKVAIKLGNLFIKTNIWCLCLKHAGSNLKKTLLQVLGAHRDEVWFLQFSNNGKYLASASNDKTAIIWEVSLRTYPSKICCFSWYVYEQNSLSPSSLFCCSMPIHELAQNLLMLLISFCVLKLAKYLVVSWWVRKFSSHIIVLSAYFWLGIL